MGQIVTGETTVNISDDRMFAHVRAAVISLITGESRSFFVEMSSAQGRTAALCSPHLPLELIHSGVLPEDDNDTWVRALVAKTIATGTLSVFDEDQAESVLRRALEALDERE